MILAPNFSIKLLSIREEKFFKFRKYLFLWCHRSKTDDDFFTLIKAELLQLDLFPALSSFFQKVHFDLFHVLNQTWFHFLYQF